MSSKSAVDARQDTDRAATIDAFNAVTTLDQLEATIGRVSASPGWIRRETPLLIPEMHSAFVPAHWHYQEMKAALQAAGRVIGTDLAERRNFVLRNPIKGNDFATLRTLICAYQTMMPGDVARSHRHSPHAMRAIIESRGSYSIVDGERVPMESGDVVLTPGWSYHGHGHEGLDQCYWFDGLDLPLTHLLEPTFYEPHPLEYEPIQRTVTLSPMRFPWADTVARLAAALADPDGHFGTVIDMPTPTMPTITIKAQRWPAGWRSRPYRHTVNTVYVVLDGHGTSTIGDATFDWEFGDVVAVPGWSRIEHRASANSVAVSISDEQLMRWVNYYRFEALS